MVEVIDGREAEVVWGEEGELAELLEPMAGEGEREVRVLLAVQPVQPSRAARRGPARPSEERPQMARHRQKARQHDQARRRGVESKPEQKRHDRTLAETSDDSAREIQLVADDDVGEATDVGVHMEEILVLMEECPVADVEPGGARLAGKDGDGEGVGDGDDEGHGFEEGGAKGEESLAEAERVRGLVVAEPVQEHTRPVPGRLHGWQVGVLQRLELFWPALARRPAVVQCCPTLAIVDGRSA